MFEVGNESRDENLTEEEMFTYKEKNFIDQIRVHMFGGKGGMGCVSFDQTRVGLKGKPSGGSGGDGGSVWVRANIEEPDLSYIRSKVLSG